MSFVAITGMIGIQAVRSTSDTPNKINTLPRPLVIKTLPLQQCEYGPVIVAARALLGPHKGDATPTPTPPAPACTDKVCEYRVAYERAMFDVARLTKDVENAETLNRLIIPCEQ